MFFNVPDTVTGPWESHVLTGMERPETGKEI